ncbi:thioredoxin domain-containing protein [Nitratifractor sp.]|uniref:thioredoxin domain-containing protein n=1 Tax=Nitratifractor sp. TaxID=2268144 RepID=UPI0025E9C8CC|nr:thioredoxin domain-containing protein [Nitratifractor sp.]
MPNRLIDEQSPYLQQHAHNPVEWYPWREEAFEKARREEKPIFLSIGYSSCHWCHVMERESFENEAIAAKLNERFVSIKVDREERPDIDKHFQEIFVTMNGRAGGWPLSVFMTPEKIPFYSATYIPPEPRYGMMGFAELLDVIAEKYAKERETLVEKGKEVLEFIRPKRKIQATKIEQERLEATLLKQIETVYEPRYGGFGGAPKFPHASTLLLVMDLWELTGREELHGILTHTLDTMTLGGLYDPVDGGFCRYSTDEEWLVPHFEKMTYDNALMAEVLLRAWRLTGEEHYREIAYETLDFMLERMMREDLFFSASDADTEGEEGKYFIYEYEEAVSAFREGGIPEPEAVARRLSITPEGNFEGHSIVRFQSPGDRRDPTLRKALEILKNIRKRRTYPFIDRKVQSSWNAMMIRVLFLAGVYEERYRTQAIRSLEALEAKMAAGVTLYHSALIGHSPKVQGFLEDYAWWISALAEGYQATLDERYLIRATELVNEAVRRFYADGRWRIDDGEFRQFADDTDSSYPSSVGVMAHNLQSLRSLVEPVYEKFLYRTLEVHSYDLMRQPISRPMLAEAALRYLRDDLLLKAREERLRPHLAERLDLGYPWLYFRTALNENYQLCNNRSCFAEEESFEEIRTIVESL